MNLSLLPASEPHPMSKTAFGICNEERGRGNMNIVYERVDMSIHRSGTTPLQPSVSQSADQTAPALSLCRSKCESVHISPRRKGFNPSTATVSQPSTVNRQSSIAYTSESSLSCNHHTVHIWRVSTVGTFATKPAPQYSECTSFALRLSLRLEG